jgi:hypothetical protein
MQQGDIKKHLPPMLLAFVIGPSIVLLHELGHYFSALALGMHPQLGVMRVEIGFARLAKRIVATSSGPTVDVAICLVGLLWLIKRKRDKPFTPFELQHWLFFVLSLASLRWIIQPLFSWAIPGAGWFGLLDEQQVSSMLGLPGFVLPVMAVLFGVCAFCVSISLHPKGTKLIALAKTIPAMCLGMAVWAFIVGPAIFGLTRRSTRTLPHRAIISTMHPSFSSPGNAHPSAAPVNSVR